MKQYTIKFYDSKNKLLTTLKHFAKTKRDAKKWATEWRMTHSQYKNTAKKSEVL